jgi:uncharacterized protein (TIGR03437 family)
VLVFGGANTQSALLRAYSLDGEAIAFSRNDGAVAVFNLLRPGAPVFLVGAAPSPAAFFSGFSFDRGRGAVTISSASFGPTLAKEMIVSAFGASLANGTDATPRVSPLPTELAGTRVFVNGVEAPLLYVSPQQVNFLIPAATAEGMATISILSGDGTVSVGRSMIARVAPGIFTANQDGTGLAAANIVRVASGGAQTTEPVVQWDGTKYVPVPIDLGPEGEIVVLVLFGTGIRHRTPGGPVTATIGGQAVQVDYAGPQNFFAGLDQVNIPLPRSLAGRGDVTVALSVDGVAANPVRIRIK